MRDEPDVNRVVSAVIVIVALALALGVILKLAAKAIAASERRPPTYAELLRQRDEARRQRTHYRLGYLKLRRAIRAHAREGYVGAALQCIHRYEGSWRDDGAPYWGGLQMDRRFMQTYGRPLYDRYGTADNWPPEAQIAVGVIAVHSGRGFGPWPLTRRRCGL